MQSIVPAAHHQTLYHAVPETASSCRRDCKVYNYFSSASIHRLPSSASGHQWVVGRGALPLVGMPPSVSGVRREKLSFSNSSSENSMLLAASLLAVSMTRCARAPCTTKQCQALRVFQGFVQIWRRLSSSRVKNMISWLHSLNMGYCENVCDGKQTARAAHCTIHIHQNQIQLASDCTQSQAQPPGQIVTHAVHPQILAPYLFLCARRCDSSGQKGLGLCLQGMHRAPTLPITSKQNRTAPRMMRVTPQSHRQV